MAGAAWQAFATDGTMLLAARFVLGLGSAASFMASFLPAVRRRPCRNFAALQTRV